MILEKSNCIRRNKNMSEITFGEERYINEAGKEWKRLVDNFVETIDEVPAEIVERIDTLYEDYKAEFDKYYRAEADKRKISFSDEVLCAFDMEWDKKHPEFYDMYKLFEGCSTEVLEKHHDALEWLHNRFN